MKKMNLTHGKETRKENKLFHISYDETLVATNLPWEDDCIIAFDNGVENAYWGIRA